MGQGGSATDLKSDTDSKSAAPALLCEASCSGLILSELMRGGLGLWHPSRDSEKLPWVPVLPLLLLMSIRVNLSWRKKGNKKTRCYCEQNLKIWSLSSHSWEFVDLTWCLTGRLLIISICLRSPGCDRFSMKLLTETSYQPRFPTSFALLWLNVGICGPNPILTVFVDCFFNGRDPFRSLLAWGDISLLVWKGTGSFP